MKARLFVLITLAALILTLNGCNGKGSTGPEDNPAQEHSCHSYHQGAVHIPRTPHPADLG